MADKQATSIFDMPEFEQFKPLYDARRSRFLANWKYYKAEYGKQENQFSSAPGQYVNALIKNAIKPLFTPLARAVNIDVALVPGDWKLSAESAPLQPAVELLFDASEWETEGDIWVRYGVAMGETGLRLVDDRDGQRIYLQPERPDSYLPIWGPYRSATPQMVITIEMDGEDELATVITPEQFAHFKNGELAAPDENRQATYPNLLGFVPFIIAKHDVGDGNGEPTFDDSVNALDQVNRQATYMSQIIERHAEPQWAAIGAEAGDLEKSGEAVWFFPEGSDIKAILAQVDFAGLLEFIREIKMEMKDGLPELAFAKLVGVERVAAATIELQMAEAVFKIRRLRKAYDLALRKAFRHVGRAASQMRLPELAVLETPEIRLDKNRPVITIDALTRLQIEQAQLSTELSQASLERERLLSAAAQGSEGDPANG